MMSVVTFNTHVFLDTSNSTALSRATINIVIITTAVRKPSRIPGGMAS